MNKSTKFKLKPGIVILTYGSIFQIIRWSLYEGVHQYKVKVIRFQPSYSYGDIIWISKDAAEIGVILDEEAKARLI